METWIFGLLIAAGVVLLLAAALVLFVAYIDVTYLRGSEDERFPT
jgi:hypothetical protein